MSIFDDIQKKKADDVEKAAKERAEKINELRDKFSQMLHESDLNVQEASFALRSTQDRLNTSLFNKPVSDFI